MFHKKRFGAPQETDPEKLEMGYSRMRLPNPDDLEQFAVVTQLMGSNQVKAYCEDGVEKQFRIPGKLMKKVWLRENDIIIVQLWDFQPSKGNVVWRYLGNQVEWLRRNGKLAKLQG
ncbi:MAG: translation initiation factor eIF-1A [Candidatus Diapherotrites archaeon]|nr:translation initiation factor eIF-1A [Candidatus Diapherotrites archaeon]